jgi:hypothetical protein
MEVAENHHLNLTLPLNKIACQEQLFAFFEKELEISDSKIDKTCFKEILQNLSNCQVIKNNNTSSVTLHISGWKSMSRKNERLFDYFIEVLNNAQLNRLDGIIFNYKLVE